MLQKLNFHHFSFSTKPSFLDRWLRPALILILVVMTAAVINILLTNFVFTGLSVGTSAPNFLGQTLDGRPVNLAEMQGQPVMLTFWSPDCFACREELPALQALSTDPNATMQLITIVSQMDQVEVEAFLAEQQLTFPVIVDEPGLIARQYKVSGIPFTYFIDQDGKIDQAVMGAGREGELQDQLFTWLRSCQIGEACSVE